MNKLLEIANHLKDWEVKRIDRIYYCLLNHKVETQAKIYLHLLDSRVSCSLGFDYKGLYVFNYLKNSKSGIWEKKKATANSSRSSQKIAKEFERKLLNEYLQSFPDWRKAVEKHLDQEKTKILKCLELAQIIKAETYSHDNETIFAQGKYLQPSIKGKCQYIGNQLFSRLELDFLSIEQAEIILAAINDFK